MYEALKTLHLAGVVLLVGNVTASAVWKAFADRTGDVRIIAFSQRMITLTDWTLTISGIIMIAAGGYGMTLMGGHSLTEGWLAAGQALFVASGAIWLFGLVPIQIAQAKRARQQLATGRVTSTYRRECLKWQIIGVIATLPLIGAIVVMTVKPNGWGFNGNSRAAETFEGSDNVEC